MNIHRRTFLEMGTPAATGTLVVASTLLVGSLLAGCAAPGAEDPGAPSRTSSPSATPLRADSDSAVSEGTGISTITDEGVPTRVMIDEIGVDEGLYGVGLQADGAMDVPAFGDAAWFDPGPEPGEAGPAVIVAHVSSPQGPDVFERLDELEPGDTVIVERTDAVVEFVVTGSEQSPKDSLPYDRIWNETDQSVLRLITCGGSWDASTGHYLDNIIVYAELVG